MFWIRRINRRGARWAYKSPDHTNHRTRLGLETLEERLCLSRNPYLFVDSYGNDSIMRYDERSAAPAPADGQMGAVFVPPGSNHGNLSTPLSVNFTPAGTILVDSAEQNRIYQYDSASGDYLGQFISFGDGGLQAPTGMIFSPDGQSFYVLSNFNNRLIRFDYDGTQGINPVTLVSGSELASPAGIVFGPDGNLYVSTLNSSAVLRYDPNTGDPLPGPGQTGANFIAAGSGGLNRCGGIVFGPDGNLYVANQIGNDILRFDGTTGAPLPADGQSGATFVAPGSGSLNDPAGILFGPGSSPGQQNLYVVSINTSNVLQFDGATGQFVGEFVADGSGGLLHPREITFGNTDPATLAYVAPALSATGTNLTAITGQEFAAIVASFNDSGTPGSATDYSAVIDWGDGTDISVGGISELGGGNFDVPASHIYGAAGEYQATITITDNRDATRTATAITTIDVMDPGAPHGGGSFRLDSSAAALALALPAHARSSMPFLDSTIDDVFQSP